MWRFDLRKTSVRKFKRTFPFFYNHKYSETLSLLQRFFNIGDASDAEKSIHSAETFPSSTSFWYQRFFQFVYTPIITHSLTQTLTFVSYLAYILITYFGVRNLVVGFDVSSISILLNALLTIIFQLINIVTFDSPSRPFLLLRSEYFPEDVSRLDLASTNPPNMGNRTQRDAFIRTIKDFENSTCVNGRNFTEFWYFEWENYIRNMGFENSLMDLDQDSQVGLFSFNFSAKYYVYTHVTK